MAAKTTARRALKRRRPERPVTLAIDVGGTHLKAAALDARGRMVSRRTKVDTPKPCPPARFIAAASALARPLGPYDRVSVGFPGLVRLGRVTDAPNLSERGWKKYDLRRALEKALEKPVRVANDADMHGLAVIRGKGIELVVTLGTGVGTSLFEDGMLLPHLELGVACHPAPKGETYNAFAGDRTRRRLGNAVWSRRILKMLAILRDVTHYDRVYVGGGNSKHLALPPGSGIRRVSNKAGILGGIALWRHAHEHDKMTP